MRILHTADWHLGHRLYNRDRTSEHRATLRWLLDTIREQHVDLLILAGDVFDVTNPSNQAKELYYEFLSGLRDTPCAAAVVIGGNHDSPSLLDAPRALLRQLNLHVVGAAEAPAAERVLELSCGGGSVVVAAVPYLRERDLRTAQFGESSADRLDRIRAGIRQHFDDVAEAACRLRSHERVPLLATGHLFAGGASDDEEKKSYIYQADEHNIEAHHFPDCFDYVALGHVHRAQHIGSLDHVRYAGSLLPLSFVEGQTRRSVTLVDLECAGQAVAIRKLPVPLHRKLIRLHGPLPEALAGLKAAAQDCGDAPLTPWVEVRVQTDEPIPNLRDKLQRAIIAGLSEGDSADGPELLRISTERRTPRKVMADPADLPQLDELRPDEVFGQLCDRHDLPTEHRTRLAEDFAALRNWVQEQDEL